MKKKLCTLALVTAIASSAAVIPTVAEACGIGEVMKQENQEHKRVKRWSAEHPHHPNESTHLWIARNAVQIMSRSQDKTVQENELQFLNTPEYKELFERGLYDADYRDEFNDGGTGTIGIDGLIRGGWKSHFYDPDTRKNYKGEEEPTALSQGDKYFKLAGEYFKRGDQKQAFYYLGVATHYFTDATQPMHAANFTAVDMSALKFHSAFENYVTTIHTQFEVKDDKGTYNLVDSNDPKQWIHETAKLAKAEIMNITNDNIKTQYNKGNNALWQREVMPAVQRSLEKAQRNTAGFIHLWFKTYVGKTAAEDIENTVVKDSKGEAIQENKKYFIVPSEFSNRGLTFEVYARNDYALLSNYVDDHKVHGTPVQFVFDKENNGILHRGESVLLKMTQSNYDNYVFLNYSNLTNWVHLAKQKTNTAQFKLYPNPNNSSEYYLYTDGYPVNYQENGKEKIWVVLGKKTDKPKAWKFIQAE
ncbi:zinc dependent phospholipase C family protein [Bacillus sp. TL12]|uniref:zinc dependent phospholipase C family protein n=1 Tax=Bacillus sp. TL12 TaxID=2894756 RepID=UPI001F524219|nr:zinc dependent phospholipase C family protein [Bacillus sp. TL12]MCI0765000.1 zinc dependent phospholipase C family protein [Bacillus sp. TL12]